MTDIILSDGSTVYWKTSQIGPSLFIPLDTVNLTQASKLSLSLIDHGRTVQTLNLPLTPHNASITTVENKDGIICLYSTHTLRPSYLNPSFAVIFSNAHHSVQTDLVQTDLEYS